MQIHLSVEVYWKAAPEYHESCAKQIQDLTLVSVYPFSAFCASGVWKVSRSAPGKWSGASRLMGENRERFAESREKVRGQRRNNSHTPEEGWHMCAKQVTAVVASIILRIP